MSFQLSPELDKNKVFLVNHSELEGRLDTVFYQPKYMANEDAIKKSKWGYEKVGHIAKRIADGPFGSDLKVDEYQPSGNPLLRVSNIRTGEIAGKLVYISDEKQEQLKRSKVYPNDVLLTKAGAILGYSAVFPESLKEGNITSHLVTITSREDINPYYLSHFFRSNLGQLQIYRWGNKSTRPELNTGEVENIIITTPPLKIQNEIVEKLNFAYATKKQKEAEAQQLLDSIDDYLLAELGIELPEQTESILKSCIFTRKLSEVSGGRFDAFYYKNEFESLIYGLDDGRFPIKNFFNFVTYISSGATPLKSESHKYYTNDRKNGIPLLRVQNITSEGIKLDDAIFINKKTHETELKRSQVFEGDLLITITGRIASSAVAPEDFEGNINQHSVIVRTNQNDVLNDYLAIYFNSYLGQNLALRETTGGTRPALDYSALKSIKIPLPPIEKQTEIAGHIQSVRNQVKHLQQQAKAELEQAKKEVEAMILGEA